MDESFSKTSWRDFQHMFMLSYSGTNKCGPHKIWHWYSPISYHHSISRSRPYKATAQAFVMSPSCHGAQDGDQHEATDAGAGDVLLCAALEYRRTDGCIDGLSVAAAPSPHEAWPLHLPCISRLRIGRDPFTWCPPFAFTNGLSCAVQGDCHPHNVLLERQRTDEARLRLIDFEMIGLGSNAQVSWGRMGRGSGGGALHPRPSIPYQTTDHVV